MLQICSPRKIKINRWVDCPITTRDPTGNQVPFCWIKTNWQHKEIEVVAIQMSKRGTTSLPMCKEESAMAQSLPRISITHSMSFSHKWKILAKTQHIKSWRYSVIRHAKWCWAPVTATRSSRIISLPRAAWKIRISLPLLKMQLWVISNTTRAGLLQLKSFKQTVERLASRGAFWIIRLKVRWTLVSHLTPRLWMLLV